jgi:hypothetical protein
MRAGKTSPLWSADAVDGANRSLGQHPPAAIASMAVSV